MTNKPTDNRHQSGNFPHRKWRGAGVELARLSIPPTYPPNLHTRCSSRLQQTQSLARLEQRFRDIAILHFGSRAILLLSISQEGSRSLFNGAGSMQMSVKSPCKPDRGVTRTGVGNRDVSLSGDCRQTSGAPHAGPRPRTGGITPHAQAPLLPAHICRGREIREPHLLPVDRFGGCRITRGNPHVPGPST